MTTFDALSTTSDDLSITTLEVKDFLVSFVSDPAIQRPTIMLHTDREFFWMSLAFFNRSGGSVRALICDYAFPQFLPPGCSLPLHVRSSYADLISDVSFFRRCLLEGGHFVLNEHLTVRFDIASL